MHVLCVHRVNEVLFGVCVWERDISDAEFDLHVDYSPLTDCSRRGKCGGNFTHGRSSSIIKCVLFFSFFFSFLDY